MSFLHYGGAWYSAYLPMSDASTYDNTGATYNTTRVLSQSFTLDEQAYSAYSPLFISTTFAMSYGLSFAAISSLVVYTWLNSRHYIMRQWRASTQDKPDVHMKMMGRYPEAPSAWYMGLFAIVSGPSLCVGMWSWNAYSLCARCSSWGSIRSWGTRPT